MVISIRATALLCTGLAFGDFALPGQVTAVKRKQMEADATAARKNFARFRAAFVAKDGESFLVKKVFTDGKSEELLWVAVKALSRDTVEGTIRNRPSVVKNVSFGETVEMPVNGIADWLIQKHGLTYAGGYSLHDEEPLRSMRLEADAANMPFFVLDRFLAGMDLRKPLPGGDLPKFKKASWNKLWVRFTRDGLSVEQLKARKSDFDAKFDGLALRHKKIRILLNRERKPRSKTFTLESDREAGFGRGELVFKVHSLAQAFLKDDKEARFAGLLFVDIDASGLVTYTANTGR